MPFPLAHPAAVLPLRRYGRFSFSALVIGSVVPDLGYMFASLRLDEFSHTFAGSLGFGLPAGLVVFWVFTRARSKVVQMLPNRLQNAVASSTSGEAIPPYTVVISLLIGTWTHIIWDSFTHKNGWIVLHLAVLQQPIGSMFGHTVRVFHLLWYISSFVGVAVLWLAYEKWKRRQNIGQKSFSPGARAASSKAMLLGVLALALGAAHHLHSWIIFSLTGLATALVLLAVEWRNWARLPLNSN